MGARRQAQTEENLVPRHWAEWLPYRALVYVRSNRSVPLFKVAGVAGGPWNAERALRAALEHFPARCFYCDIEKKKAQLTIDHVDPRVRSGSGDLTNLVLACRTCNGKKDSLPVEVFRPDAGREWLSSILRQVQERLNRLP